MSPLRIAAALATLVIPLLVAPAGAVEAPAEPQQVVQLFQDSLIAAMKQGPQAGYAGRYRLLEPALKQAFDFDTIAMVVLGQYWPQLQPTQRTAFVDIFSRLSIATYASRFDTYSGEYFSPPKLGKASDDRAIVHSDLIDGEDNTVSFTYQMRKSDGQWRIINVIASGVSDLAVKRAEYTEIIKNNSFDTLFDRLKQKIAAYAAAKPADAP